jgi:hypothetical protein
MRARSSGLSSFQASAKGGSYTVDIFREDSSGLHRIFLVGFGMGEIRDVSLEVLSLIRPKSFRDALKLLGAGSRSFRGISLDGGFRQFPQRDPGQPRRQLEGQIGDVDQKSLAHLSILHLGSSGERFASTSSTSYPLCEPP